MPCGRRGINSVALQLLKNLELGSQVYGPRTILGVMVKSAEFLRYLSQRFHTEIKSHVVDEPVAGVHAEFPDTLDGRLQEVLKAQGIGSLYQHQREAFDRISDARDTLLVSRTASGKTLSFLLPILNAFLAAPAPFSVILIYPTKALSRDQEGTLGRLMRAAGIDATLGTFDGDTPRDERTRIQRSAHFLITNPDMLHSGILPNHNRRWKTFLSRLRFVVVDEVHMYRGAFGSHVSNVFRRLIRICGLHGSSPCFVGSSATIGNPGVHAQALFHRPFSVVENDASPRPRRDLFLVNPPLVQSHGDARYRKGPAAVTIPLIRKATELGIRTICFCRARQQVERLHRAVVDRHPDLRHLVKPYRGGLLPNERRALERDLASGRLNTIITTNALELGIDIGDLDLCLLSGHPGSVASFWQQAGRVGRKGNQAVIIYVARDTPVDQYLVNHAEFITNTAIEQAWLNADNPYIMMQHLPCAAHEHPLRVDEAAYDSSTYEVALDFLRKNGTVKPYHDCFRYALKDYPAKGVSLRGMTDYNIDIYCGTEVIGELDPIGARGTLYKDAIYQHLGTRYMSLNLDLQKKLCEVEEVKVDYYTEATWEGRVNLTEVDDTQAVHGADMAFGSINVNRQPKLYKKIRERSYENIGYGPITLDPFIYDTTGFSLLPPPSWHQAIAAVDKRYVGAALFGLAYVLKHCGPSLCMGDVRDIDTDISQVEGADDVWCSTLFLFDTHEGGVGYAEKIYERIDSAFTLCREIIDACDCDVGCPACVTPLPPGVTDPGLETCLIVSDAAVRCTESLLTAMITGAVVVPEIRSLTTPISPCIDPAPEDAEMKALRRKMSRAADNLKQKRERQH